MLGLLAEVIQRNLLAVVAFFALIGLFLIVMYRRVVAMGDRKIDDFLSRRAPPSPKSAPVEDGPR